MSGSVPEAQSKIVRYASTRAAGIRIISITYHIKNEAHENNFPFIASIAVLLFFTVNCRAQQAGKSSATEADSNTASELKDQWSHPALLIVAM